MGINIAGTNRCVHVPIPATVESDLSTIGPNASCMLSFSVNGQNLLGANPRLYNLGDSFAFDMAPWAKLALGRVNAPLGYTTAPATGANAERVTIDITANITQGSGGETLSTSNVFYNCALYSGSFENDTEPIRVWKGYPISWLNPTGTTYTALIAQTKPTINTREVEFVEDCPGTMLMWLNVYGSFNYWVFPFSRIYEREGKELYRVNRNIFNPANDRTSNENTVGFDVTETLKVGDLIPKKYWSTIKSLVGSPDVYMLKPESFGKTTLDETDWIKIIQSDVKFERNELNRTATEFDAEFDLPRVYSQQYI